MSRYLISIDVGYRNLAVALARVNDAQTHDHDDHAHTHFTLLDIRREDCLDGKKRPSHEKTAYCVCLRMHEILLYYRATFVDFEVDTVHVVIEQQVRAAPINIALKSAIVGMLYGKFGIGGGNPRFSIKYMPARRKFDCLASPGFASCLAEYVNAHDDVEMPDHDLKKKSVVVSTALFINSFASAAVSASASCTGGLFAIDERCKQRATLEQIFNPDSSLVGKKRPRRGGKGRGKGKLDDVCDVLLQICTEVVAGGEQAQKKRKTPRSCPHVVIIDDDDGSNSGSGSGSRGRGSDHPHGGCSSEGGVEVEDGSLDLQLARETSASVRTGSPTLTTNPTKPTNPRTTTTPTNPTTTTTTEPESKSKAKSKSKSTRSTPGSATSTPGSATSRSPKRALRSAHPVSSSSCSSSSRLRRTGDVVQIEIAPVPEPPCDPAAESSESFH